VQQNVGRDRLTQAIAGFRREMAPDFVLMLTQATGDADFSLAQLATLYLLEGRGEHSVKQIADMIGRSLSATSRLLDQLAKRGLVSRHEDERDRRAKRVVLTERGRTLLRDVERGRADAQLAIMAYLSDDEREIVHHAMTLLAQAARRRHDALHPNPTHRDDSSRD
jgi:DNA-binding MarR family transcriptional regulator